MNYIFTPYSFALFVATFVGLAIAVISWRKRAALGAIYLFCLELAVAEWALAIAFESAATDLATKVLLGQIAYLGNASSPLFYLLFAIAYSQPKKKLSGRIIAALSIVPVITIIMAWTNAWHGWLWPQITIDPATNLAVYEHGLWWWVFVSYSYLLIMIGLIRFYRTLFRFPVVFRPQRNILLIGSVVPFIGNLLYVFKLTPTPGLDWTPVTFSISGGILAWGIFKYGLFDLVPITRDRVVEWMGDSVLLLDNDYRIVDLNPAAQRLTGLIIKQVIGQPISETLSGWPDMRLYLKEKEENRTEIVLNRGQDKQYYDLRTSPLYIQRDSIAGWLLALRDITERKQAEVALRKSETRFRELFNNMDNGVAVYQAINDGEDFIFTDFNRSGEKIEKIMREEIIGKRVTEAFPGIKDFGLFEVFQRVWRTGEPEHHPISFYKIKGLTGWRENFIYKLPSGEIVAIYSDKTKRKRTEEELQESEERFKKLSNLTFEGILIHDKGVAIDVNESLTRLFGYAREEMIGKNIINLCVSQEYHALINENIIKNIAKPYEAVARKKDGTLFPIEIEARDIKSKDEEFRVAAIRDITERKRVEAALRESEEKYRSFVDTATDLMTITDKDGHFTDMNEAMIEVLGYPREELSGMHFTQVLTEEALENDFKPNWEKFIEDGKINVDTTFLTKNGNEIPGELKAIAVYDVSGNFLGSRAVISDLTERVRAEEELKKHRDNLEELIVERTQELRDAQEKLIRHERLAALGQMAGGVGHELRNPLSIITNAIYYLKMILPDANEKTRQYLEMINSETQSASKIIADLLDFARIKSIDREKVTASELIAKVMTKHPPPKNVDVNIHIPNDLPPLHIDSAQIGQVLTNLVANAYQAMPDGGELSVFSEQCSVSSEQLLNTEHCILLAVSDTGAGISPENMDKIFEPLFTTKTKGIGLGLAISKLLVEANGGNINLESVVGEGTTFTLLLPTGELVS